MVAADLARALVLLSLPATYLAGAVTLGQLYAVALLTGTAAVLFNTSYSAFFAHLVPRASYVDANSKLSTSRSASYVAGPAPIAIAALAGGPLWVRGGALALAEFLAGIGVMFFDINLNSLQAAVIHDPPPHHRTGGPADRNDEPADTGRPSVTRQPGAT